MQKIRTQHLHPKGKVLSWIAFFMGFGISLVLPIMPNFVKSIIHSDSLVSLFYAGVAIMMLIAALVSTVVFKKVERTTITKYSFLVSGIVFFALIFVSRITELAIIETIRGWFNLFLLMTIVLFVRDFADEKNLGEEEGLFYRADCFGYLLGFLLGGFFATKFGYEFVFILAATVFFIGLAYFYHLHIIQNHPALINKKKISSSKLLHNIKKFFSNPNLARTYAIKTIFMLWVSFKRLYIPLYVIMSGYLASMSGVILALSIIPLILFEVKAGKYADKHGVRLPISVGFVAMGVTLLLVFLSHNLLINFLLLSMVSIGGAFVEPLQEYSLFKNVQKGEEEDMYGVYMTSDPVAYFLTPGIGALTLLLLPFNYLFLVFAVIMFSTSIFTWFTLKHS